MTRSWLTFGLGLLFLVSPLRAVWARPGAPGWTIFLVWATLVAVGFAISRGRR